MVTAAGWALTVAVLACAAAQRFPDRDYVIFGPQPCGCDLDPLACDVDCCCDTACTNTSDFSVDCAAEAVAAAAARALGLACGTKTAHYVPGEDMKPLLCVERVTTSVVGLYFDLEEVDTQAFSPPPAATQGALPSVTATAGFLSVGDIVPRRKTATGHVAATKTAPTTCPGSQPVRFLQPVRSTTVCPQPRTNIAAECTPGGAWAAAVAMGTTAAQPLNRLWAGVNGDPIPVSLTLRDAETNLESIATEPPEPVWDAAAQTCVNATVACDVIFLWTAQRITEVRITLTVATLDATEPGAAALAQAFSTTFVPTANASNTTAADVYLRSGSPGYLPGLPLRAGRYAAPTLTSPMTLSPFVLTLPAGGISGRCGANDTQTLSVEFGTDAVSECYIELSRIEFQNCSALRARLLDATMPSWSDVVLGLYGDADPAIATDWLPLLFAALPGIPLPSSAAQTGFFLLETDTAPSCENLPRAWELLVVIAPQGFHERPQWRIVGAELRPVLETFTWMTDPENPGQASSLFPIATAVRFSRVDDLTLQGRRRAPPEPVPRCRHSLCASEWFYPLSHTAAGGDDRQRQYTVACAMFMAVAGLFLALGTCIQTPSRDLHGV